MPDLRHSHVQDPRRQSDYHPGCTERAGTAGGQALLEPGKIMAQQLAYVIITPYSLHKSRTGGILSRLITRTGLDLAGARMFAPSSELVKQYCEETISANDPQDRRIQELIYTYILQNFSPDAKTGRRRRVLMMLFQGEDAVRKTRSVVGNIST